MSIADRGVGVRARIRFVLAAAMAIVLPVVPSRAVAQQAARQAAADKGRPDVGGITAAIVAGHPLAAEAGAEVLRRGGNAVDAAITAAAVLGVVRPHMNGLGADAFLLIRNGKTGEVVALNGSGRAGSLATPDFFHRRGLTAVPDTGVLAVTVPGALRAWADALGRFGTITLAQALAPAIHYARDGFPVSRTLAEDIRDTRALIARDSGMAALFLPGGRPLEPGSRLRNPDLARTLEAIAQGGPDVLYRGSVAQEIAAYMKRMGGLITAKDLASHTSTWTTPLRTTYTGYQVLAFPPNSQGLVLLEQMNMAELFDLQSMAPISPEYIDLLVRIKKLAFADRNKYISDPAFVDVPVQRLISKAYAKEKVKELKAVQSQGASDGTPGGDGNGDTVFLCVVDKDGNAVSLIQSNYALFGSGRMVPGTGFILQNRGALFSLDPEAANVIAPGKRTYHTLSPAMVLNGDGSLAMLMGTPGGDGQTQTLMQVFNDVALYGYTPQQAVEAPRWRSFPDGSLQLEPGFPAQTAEKLQALGNHVVLRTSRSHDFGGAQIIQLLKNGVLRVGADPRREAYGLAW
jgi:gamma-glutamyltranspeptidase / glutathione hydrolase